MREDMLEHGVKIIDLKSAKGKNIFLIPNGNARRRKIPLNDQIIEGKLTECGSKKGTVEGIGSFYLDGDYDAYNCSYLPFLLKQDALDYIEKKDFLSSIKNQDLTHLAIEDIKRIKKIIENQAV